MNIADINAEARALVDADSTSLSDATLLRRINAAYEQTVGKIIAADGTWDFDDTNYTDLPIATANLVADQRDYSFSSAFLDIQRVEVKDIGGTWRQLNPIDKSDLTGTALTEYQKTSALPAEYDKQGISIFLYPAPSATYATLTAGLKVYFKRSAATFTSGEVSTGTKEPGFASPYHILLAYKAALPYAISYKPTRVGAIVNEIARLEKELIAFYSHREEDVRAQITMQPINFR